MVLQGIELAEPERWYYYVILNCGPCAYRDQGFCTKGSCPKYRNGYYQPLFFAQPCELPGWEWLDTCLAKVGGVWGVFCGVTGNHMRYDPTPELAMNKTLARLNKLGDGEVRRRIILFLETHLLSPRYRWAHQKQETEVP